MEKNTTFRKITTGNNNPRGQLFSREQNAFVSNNKNTRTRRILTVLRRNNNQESYHFTLHVIIFLLFPSLLLHTKICDDFDRISIHNERGGGSGGVTHAIGCSTGERINIIVSRPVIYRLNVARSRSNRMVL